MKNIFVTIDNGNTHPHVGIFYAYILQEVIPLKDFINHEEYKNDNCTYFLSSVGAQHPFIEQVKAEGKVISINHLKKEKLFVDMPFNYTPSIGDDRLFEAFYTYTNFVKSQKHRRVLLIDAGTFTTMDIVSLSGLEGGLIFPGARALSLAYEQGVHLPHMQDKIEQKTSPEGKLDIPHSTEDAITSAVSIIKRGMYKEFFENYGTDFDLCILTGGQSQQHKSYLEKFLNPSIINIEPHFIHYSMLSVYNRAKKLGGVA